MKGKIHMKYIQDLKDGMAVRDIYLVKQKNSAVTKAGKEYLNVTIQDKTGVLEGKIWDTHSPSIIDFDVNDYVYIYGDMTTFQGKLQLNIKQTRPVDPREYNPMDYFPVTTKNIDDLWKSLCAFADSVKNPYLHTLLQNIFIKDEALAKRFKENSAAKSVHHGFIGGLLEHTVSVTSLCDFYSAQYPALNRDLLITAALLHDIGKTKEISLFPENDYTDEGNLLGHIVIGTEMIGEYIREIPDFPPTLAAELKHCIVAHHGKLEFGSPKVPAIMEAVALNFADDTDAKMEAFTELNFRSGNTEWQGFNRIFDSNVRATRSK